MKRVTAITMIALVGVGLVSASTFQRFDAPLRWSPAIESVMSEYEDGASAVTIVPPEDDDDDWTVIFVYPNESAPEWI
jgi:hypothetical protein